MDKIIIKNIKIFAHHGVLDSEKKNGQEFFVDCVMYTDLQKAGLSDDVKDTVDYAKACEKIAYYMTNRSCNLIETAAKNVVDGLFCSFECITEIELTVKKPNAPINAEFDYVAVYIKRERSDL